MFPQPLQGPNAPFMALVGGKKELICWADRNKKCVACFVLCNWLWRVCGVCQAATQHWGSAVPTYCFILFFNNCMNGEWNIVFLRSCLFTTVTVFDPRPCVWVIVYVFLFPFSRDSGQRGSNAEGRICCYQKKGLCAFVHIAGQLWLCYISEKCVTRAFLFPLAWYRFYLFILCLLSRTFQCLGSRDISLGWPNCDKKRMLSHLSALSHQIRW